VAGLSLTAVCARAQSAPPVQIQSATKGQADAPADQNQAKGQAKVLAKTADAGQADAKPADQNQAKNADAGQTQTQTASQSCPVNPEALGVSRVLPIDFGAYQQLGRMQYPDSLPLNDKEVVITFDDGPLLPYTDQVLDILAAQCVKATFFMVGEMAHSFPATVRRVYEEGHTIGTHSDHHPIGFGKLPVERMQREIDGGIADVSAAFGGDPRYLAPFFRIPGLERSDLLESELAERGLITFSADVVADDWHRDITPAKIISLAMSRLEKRGKGILLLHDIHPKTVAALPGLLQQLKEQGFHVVQVVPSAAYETAMARRPAAGMLASANPDELMINYSEAAPPVWPPSAEPLTPDAAVLPVPDAEAFEPDADLADASGEVHWPDAPPSTASSVAEAAAPKGSHRRLGERSERRKLHAVRSVEHERIEKERRPEHRHAHAKAGADGGHADLMTRIRAVAALFSPAQATR
jgi:peptidoglycan/xylan/chitin deacetylase (PgdA/CDA1 family)